MSETKPTKKTAQVVEPSMLLIESSFMENPSEPVKNFSGIPVKDDCPYIELIFDPKKKILGVISKHIKQSIQSITKLDNNGFPKETTNKKFKEQFPFQQERLLMDTYHEYYIRNEKEIEEFLNMHAVNPKFDWKSYLK
jgi:hypothetical protein